MKRPHPLEVRTGSYSDYMNLCDGMKGGSEKEATCRLYCIAAQKNGRWGMTQEELNQHDSSGTFYWNGLVDEGWFVFDNRVQKYYPTDLFFGRLMANDLIQFDQSTEDEDEFDEDDSQLILFAVRVVYENKDKRNSYFTVLDISPDAASETVLERVLKFRNIKIQRGPIVKVEVTEIEGPFVAGQILHEQR